MKKFIYLLFMSIFVFTSCNQDGEIIDLSKKSELIIKKENNKVDICHFDKDTGEYHTINVSENAVEAHLAHGDAVGNCDDIVTICKDEETIRVNKFELENYEPFTLGDCDNGQVPGEEYTYVPDDNFERELILLGYDNELDNLVFTSNISSIESLNVKNKNINDLTGIEDFVNLKQLFAHQNNLKQLNLSNNSKLLTLYCSDNQLTSLSLLNHLKLSGLYCQNNLLTSLNLTDNSNLKYLFCQFNQLSNIDISKQPLLNNFQCNSNLLTNLDVSNNPNLTRVSCFDNSLVSLNVQNGFNVDKLKYLAAKNNPNLICIQVDNVSDANNLLYWSKDDIATYSLNCESN